MFAVSRCFVPLAFTLFLIALAAPDAGAEPVPGAPQLRWRTDAPPAAQLDLEVAFAVSGIVAEARVRQRFRNDGKVALDGDYLLPLPPGAAVHHLRLRVGERVIEGEIREREIARAEFAAAAAAGHRASLVEQHQSNIFRTAVANVAPGETVEVEIGYWQRVAWQDSRFELAFPLGFVPRYELAAPVDEAGAGAVDAAAAVLAAPRVEIAVALEPGLPLRAVESESHAIRVDRSGSGYAIALAGDRVPADRDFVLRWYPEPSNEPTAALMVEQTPGADYALVMIVPPAASAVSLPRELILVLDTSGSMLGRSLAQAKAAAARALNELEPTDRLNVIQFNSVTEALFERPAAASADAVRVAREWVEMLEATGGTDMQPALDVAFAQAASPSHVRQIVFITDGAVNGEEQLYTLIESRLGSARLFPVGIGDAPNAGFLQQAARMGRGAALTIRDLTEVDARMGELFAKLDRPALRDLDLHWPELGDTYPSRLPDLYAGEPLVAVAKLKRAEGQVEALGQRQGASWAKSLPLTRSRSDAGVARLWARWRIDELEDQLRRGADPATIKAQILDVALAHRLVTRHTSFVAVDRSATVARSPDSATVTFANGTREAALAFAEGATAAPLSAVLGGLGLLLVLASRQRRSNAVRA
jgi:Ca-activated chloride channel family protein